MTWQAHTVSFLLRWTFKPRLARARTIEQIRAAFGGRTPPLPADCAAIPDVVGGVKGEWLSAGGVTPAATMLYLHGGGYIACSPQSHRPITSAFAQAGFRVFAPDYRLAPEHPFPAAVEDAVAAYRGLLADTDPTKIVVAGDSAGGGLALALMISLRDQGLPQPAAAALFSPLTDFACTGNSMHDNSRRCAMFNSASIPKAAEKYLGNVDQRTPLASPLYAQLRDLPPLLVHVGANETLLDDSLRFVKRAQSAGLRIESKVWPAVPHCWQLMHRVIPEGRESLAQAGSFLRRYSAAPV
jgi:monoterpene epsilon-lactone hydrolase